MGRMGWSKSAAWCAAAAGVVLGAAACGGTDESSGSESKAGAGVSTSGGASGSASGSHAGGTAAGQSEGGTKSGGGAGYGTGAGQSAGGAAGVSGNVYVDMLRGREGCLPRELAAVETVGGGYEVGQVHCGLTEVVVPASGAACACDASQNLVPTPASVFTVIKRNAAASGLCGGAGGPSCNDLCACDLLQSAGAALTQCQTDATTPITEMPPGFCYVDATVTPPLGNAALVASCPASSRRELRILGPVAEPAPTVFVACAGASL